MRVLALGPYPPPHGGVQTNLVGIRDYLRGQGHWCGVVNLTRFRKPESDDVYYPRTALQVMRLLFGLKYDILHLHMGGMPNRQLYALSAVACSVPGKKTVLTFHSGGYPASPPGRSAAPGTVRGWIFRRFDRVIVVNPELVKLFHRFGVPPERVHLIYPHAVGPPPEAAWPDRLHEFIQGHSPFLLTVGLLETEYDLPLLIEVLGRVRRRFPRAGLVIAGAGSLEQELGELIRSKPYASDILLWGDMPHPLTLRAIAGCDMLLRTTLYDGDSVAVREALGLGTPVIATDNGMRPAGVRLIPAGDPAALYAAIEQQAGAPARPPAAAPDQRNLEAVVQLYRELLQGNDRMQS